jgi:MFS family permease
LLAESPNIAEEHVRWLTSVPPVMLILGSLAGGLIADWLLWRTGSRRISRQWFAVVSLLICAATLLLATWTGNGYQQVALVAIACLFMATGGVGSYTITLDLGGRHVATVFSTMNMFGSFGAACFPKYAGWLVDTTGSWNAVLLSMAAIYLGAAICWALLNPTGTLLEPRAEPKPLQG